MKENVVYTIEERMEIRRDAEAVLETAGIAAGTVTLVQGASMVHLLSVLLKVGVPLTATAYDMADFQPIHVSESEQQLLRITDAEKVTRVLAPKKGLVLRFPEQIGQAPVIFLEVEQRPAQAGLKLNQYALPEWLRPVEYHVAFLGEEGFIVKPEEVEKVLLQQMQGETTPPEIFSYLSEGIGLVIQVVPKTFSFRFPEFSLERVAHWPIVELQAELEEMMQRLRSYRAFSQQE